MKLTINIEYEIGEQVFNITDKDQYLYIVVGYDVLPNNLIKYKINSDEMTYSVFDFEIYRDKQIF